MKYTKEFRDYWQPFCDDEYWKDKPISISQESLSTLLDEIDRMTAYAHRLLSDESRTWHCEGCGHNFTSKAMADGKRDCPLCDAPMRPMSEIRQERIAELEAELEKHRWIPVSERLPETHFEGTGEDTVKVSGNVLVDWLYNPMAENDDLRFRATSIAYTFDDKWMNNCTGDEIEVNHEFAPTHWQYLPEPPKEDA